MSEPDLSDGGPAFPCQWEDINTNHAAATGMSKRELFAAILMHGELVTGGPNGENASRAVDGADELLLALAAPKEPEPQPTLAHLTYNAWFTPAIEHRAIQRLALSPIFEDLPAVIRDFVKVATRAIDEAGDGIPF